MPSPSDSTRSRSFRPPPSLIGLGILVIALGFGLPRLLSGAGLTPSTVESKAEPSRAESLAPANFHAEALTTDKPNLGVALARLIGGLVIVCGLCIALTRWLGKRKPAPTGTMEILASLSIDLRNAVHLIRAGERRLVVGLDLTGIKAVVELPGRFSDLPPGTVARPAPAHVPVRADAVSESSVVLGPVPVTTPATPPVPANRDEILTLLARLRGSLDGPPRSPGEGT